MVPGIIVSCLPVRKGSLIDVCQARQVENLTHQVEILEAPDKSPSDKKEYRVIKLPNGLTALLISDLSNRRYKDFVPSSGDEDTGEAIEKIDKENEDLEHDEGKERDRREDNDGEDEEGKEKERNENKEDYEDKNNKRNNEISEDMKLSAASLCIGVGHLENPREIQGLMHFLEHMVFMGSEKYPEENYFSSLISKCGGSNNAYTSFDTTNFYFDVQEMHFEKVLDVFANFFISPLMKKDAIQRERKAVHSEFQDSIDDDDSRKFRLLKSFANPGHPFSFLYTGNEKTLQFQNSDTKLYSKLHEARSMYYTAQYMTLAVQARETLDKLQELVTSIFSEIPNNSLPKPSADRFGFPYSQESFHRFFKVIPVSDIHVLNISWILPSYRKYYATNPGFYVTWYIINEDVGSIFSYLKKKLWALSLTAESDDTSGFVFLIIEILLTEEGFHHVKEIIQIVFQYIRLMRENEPNYEIFSEIQKYLQMEFDFVEEFEPCENVVDLSESMHLFPSKHLLTGDSLFIEYDPLIIKDFLSHLRIDNCNILLSSKQIENENLTWQEEEWYGTKYFVKDIPQDWIEEWQNESPNPELHIFLPNDFLPDDFEIYKWSDSSQDPPQFPEIIESSDKGKLWFKQDFKFCLPRAYCFAQCRLVDLQKSPKMEVMLEMFVSWFEQYSAEVLYPAKRAGYEVTLLYAASGFELNINGFNQKLLKCLETMLSNIEDIFSSIDEKIFYEMKQPMLKAYYDEIISPETLKSQVHSFILHEKYWLCIQNMKALEKIEKSEFVSVMKDILSNKYIRMFVQGNIKEEEAKKLFNLFTNTSSLDTCESLTLKKVRRCKPGEYVVRLRSLNAASSNSCIMNYYQGERESLRGKLIYELIMLAMEEPLFDTLRTKDQLGYDVNCSIVDSCEILGISIIVNSQADKYSLTHINGRIESFLKTFSEKLLNFSEEEMENLKKTLKNSVSIIDKSLGDEAARNWFEIQTRRYEFDRHEKKLMLIPTLTLEEVSSYLQNLICSKDNSNYRKLSIQVMGSPTPNKDLLPCYENSIKQSVEEIMELMPPTDEDLNEGFSNNQFISNLQSFIDSLTFFEDPNENDN